MKLEKYINCSRFYGEIFLERLFSLQLILSKNENNLSNNIKILTFQMMPLFHGIYRYISTYFVF